MVLCPRYLFFQQTDWSFELINITERYAGRTTHTEYTRIVGDGEGGVKFQPNLFSSRKSV